MTIQELIRKHDGLHGAPHVKNRGDESSEHAKVSVEYAQGILTGLISFMTRPDAMGSTKTLFDPVLKVIIDKQEELASLIN